MSFYEKQYLKYYKKYAVLKKCQYGGGTVLPRKFLTAINNGLRDEYNDFVNNDAEVSRVLNFLQHGESSKLVFEQILNNMREENGGIMGITDEIFVHKNLYGLSIFENIAYRTKSGMSDENGYLKNGECHHIDHNVCSTYQKFNRDYELYIKDYFEDFPEQLKNHNKIIIPVDVYFKSEGYHAIFLIIDKQSQKYILFDPHFFKISSQSKKDLEHLTQFLNDNYNLGYTRVYPSDIANVDTIKKLESCPIFQGSFKEKKGLCTLWRIYMTLLFGLQDINNYNQLVDQHYRNKEWTHSRLKEFAFYIYIKFKDQLQTYEPIWSLTKRIDPRSILNKQKCLDNGYKWIPSELMEEKSLEKYKCVDSEIFTNLLKSASDKQELDKFMELLYLMGIVSSKNTNVNDVLNIVLEGLDKSNKSNDLLMKLLIPFVDLNKAYKYDMTPLEFAIDVNNVELVNELLPHTKLVYDNRDISSALLVGLETRYSRLSGKKEFSELIVPNIIKQMVINGDDFNSQAKGLYKFRGSTALMKAISQYAGDVVRELTQNPNINIDYTIQDKSGNTHLMFALKNDFPKYDIIRDIVNDMKHVDLFNIKDNNGMTPLEYSIKNLDNNITELIKSRIAELK